MGNRIGAWDRVTADYASLQSLNGQLEFSLKRVDGTMLFRGWERTRKRFSWAGLSYSMAPKRGAFTYSVALNFQEGSP